MTRKEIHEAIKEKQSQISELENEIRALQVEAVFLCDEYQQYYEKEVEVIVSRRPKVIEKQLHGFIKWKEKFADEDNPKEHFTIERNQLVRIDGRWL